MCIPAATAALVAAGLSAAGTGVAAYSAMSQASYQAKVAEQNAAMEREAFRQEEANTKEAALAHYRNVAKLKGEQIVGAAANGVGIDFGTSADTLADTDMLAREDVKRIYDQGAQKGKARDIQASNYIGEAAAQRSAGLGAALGGALNMGSSVLGGVSQYRQLGGGGLVSSVKATRRANAAIF